jgi:glycerophosphoryl diester phosphodiesterase
VVHHPEFADRRITKTVDGVPTTGWFSEDFSLAEIKTLRARERIPDIRPQNTQFDGSFTIPTLTEIIRLLKLVEQTTGRKIGIYPETKHPTYFAQEGTHRDGRPINLSLGQLLIDTLVAEDFTDPSRIFIQSFEFANLIELQNTIMPGAGHAGIDLALIQLYGDITDASMQPKSHFSQPYDMVLHATPGADLDKIYGDLEMRIEGGITAGTGYRVLTTPAVLHTIAKTYAEGIGPWKNSLVESESLEASPFLHTALDAGLQVHPYTFRAEETFLARKPDASLLSIGDEIQHILRLGIHGFFTDQPNEGVAARDHFLRANIKTAKELKEFGEKQQ